MCIDYQKALIEAEKTRARAKNGTVKYKKEVYPLIFDRRRGGYDLLLKDEKLRLTAYRLSIAKADAIYYLSN